MISFQFLVTSLVVALVPGTGVLYTINVALTQKTRAGVYAAIGCTLGIVPHLCACFLGLSAIMHMGARAFVLIKYAGCLYLVYLAIKTWRHAGVTGPGSSGERGDAFRIVWRGIAVNVLNPKLTLFFLSFLPQFIPAGAANANALLLSLSGVFMGMTLAVFALYGILASAISAAVRTRGSPMKRLERVFALLFAGLAIQLAAAEK
jgi:threonine/homoserine/homoserine lactone efflux protein